MSTDWLSVYLVGAVSGLIGQGVRVIVGLKKTSDAAASTGDTFAALLQPSRLIISLLIGAIAGVLCAVALGQTTFSSANIFTIAAAGYAGADFIEGFMRRAGSGTDSDQENKPGAPADNQDDAVG